MIDVFPEKAGTGYSTHANFLCKFFTKNNVAIVSVFGNIEKNIVSAVRRCVANAQIIEALQE